MRSLPRSSHVILPSSALLASVLCFVPCHTGTVDHVMLCLWCHRQAVYCVLWHHKHNIMWSTVPALGRAKQHTHHQCRRSTNNMEYGRIFQRRLKFLQTLKLGRYNFFIHDDMHFEGVCWVFVELSAKIEHTGDGELTVGNPPLLWGTSQARKII